MGFGPVRNLVGPVARALLSRGIPACSPSLIPANPSSVRPEFRHFLASLRCQSRWTRPFTALPPFPFKSLTDNRLPKRRPRLGGRKKRAGSRPPAPYAVVKVQPIPPKPPKNPNKGGVAGRNSRKKKRLRLRREFNLAEKKKREALVKAANKRKTIKRVEGKMAAVAREKAWAQRLAELQKMEEEKKQSAD